MSAKRHLHLLLVASLIVLLFALVPAKAESTEINIIEIEHFSTKEENQIEINIVNNNQETIDCNLVLAIYSKDLTENILLSDSITFFDVNANKNYTHIFSFNIPLSGEYLFNLSLLTEQNGTINQYHQSEIFTFYDTNKYDLGQMIVDFYFDPEDNANWIYDEEEDSIELKNIQNSYNAGIVLGPFSTSGLAKSKLKLQFDNRKSADSQYSISLTTDFNSSEIYSTEWTIIHEIEQGNNVTLSLPVESTVFILLNGQDSSPEITNFWKINSIFFEKLSLKHALDTLIEPAYFFEIGKKQEIELEIENIGIFSQQLGNISIFNEIKDESGIIESYVSIASIESGETQKIKIDFDEILDPGNYYLITRIIILNENIFFEEKISFISVSNYNYGEFEINLHEENDFFEIETHNDNVELLINTEDIDNIKINSDYTFTQLTENFYVVSITKMEKNINIGTNSSFSGRIISIINLDQNKFSVSSESTSVETIEGITAPAVIFDDGTSRTLNVKIENQGFYAETYSLDYIYSPTFISEIHGPTSIAIQPNSFEIVEIEVEPLANIPREGGSQFNIEISNNNENKITTYVLSYLKPKIKITDISCDRHALLIGQEIKCTTTLTNLGYLTNSINLFIYSGEVVIDEVKIDSLKYLETWTLATSYKPNEVGETSIIVSAITNDGIIYENELDTKIKIVATENSERENSNEINMPNMNAGRSLIILTIAGILFQINRSENLKYLGLKFFFVPMYSRLQKDTLVDEPTRQKLLKYIYSEPGANFKQLKDKFSLHNGTLAHHINILENHDIITSHRSGRQRLFFPMGVNQEISRVSLITNETQLNIMDIVKETPGITQAMISQQLNMSRQKVNYHVNSLVDKAFIKVEKQGRITRLFPLYYT
ncbi:MAG: winged helix-turn-helix transcriptional regulator [Candidatus Thermoplasmatota archaeon]|nr:winged helix-turn-helix transcriptional regulator [Candidatus Thermoplasmatota archaeon]